jgi:hypothetical protein
MQKLFGFGGTGGADIKLERTKSKDKKTQYIEDAFNAEDGVESDHHKQINV